MPRLDGTRVATGLAYRESCAEQIRIWLDEHPDIDPNDWTPTVVMQGVRHVRGPSLSLVILDEIESAREGDPVEDADYVHDGRHYDCGPCGTACW